MHSERHWNTASVPIVAFYLRLQQVQTAGEAGRLSAPTFQN